MKLTYPIDIKEQKVFQGTDVQNALVDAERILEEVRMNHPEVAMSWDGKPERLRSAIEAVNSIIFEIDQARKSELCKMAEELAYIDGRTITQMADLYSGVGMRFFGDEQQTFLLMGNPTEELARGPWWRNMPGGREVLDWIDDFGDEIRAAYEERLYDELNTPFREQIGSIRVEDNACWVRIRSVEGK